MWDDLHGLAQVFTTAFLGDHVGVHLAGGHIAVRGEVSVQEALVVAQIQVGFRAIFGDEHFAVLERVHRARIHVEVGIQFLHGHAQSTGAE